MRAAFLGASKGIGHEALVGHLAKEENDAVVLLRNPACLDVDEVVGPAIKAGRVRIVPGDATNDEDVRKLFENKVDVVVTSVGATPSFTLRGLELSDWSVCTRATAVLLAALHALSPADRPRVVVVSSMGIGTEHHIMPFAMRILYGLLLSGPHADKEGLEYLYARAASQLPTPPAAEMPNILSASNPDAPAAAAAAATSPDYEAFLDQVTIVRPAMLTDGQVYGRPTLKAAEGLRTYTCSRADAGQFIASECMPLESREWVNKCPVVGY